MWRMYSALNRVCAQLYLKTGEKIMRKLICHADECDNSTSETFFHCEQHGGEDGEE
jgi:hypothetical protein